MNSTLSLAAKKAESPYHKASTSNMIVTIGLNSLRRWFPGPSSRSIEKLLVLLCLGLLPVTLSGCSSLENKTADTLERQIELQQIEHELEMEPASTEIRTAAEFERQGDRYLQQGDINRAFLYYAKGLGVEPDYIPLLNKQGILLLKKKKFVEAEQVYGKILALTSTDPRALAGRSMACFGQGKFDEAEQGFLSALESKTDDWLTYEYLGLIYSQRQEYERAISQFKKALSFKPNNISAANNLAVTYYLNGNFDQAVRLYRDLAASAGNRKIHNNLALAYFQMGQYENAMESFKKGTGNEATAYNNIGREYLFAKKYDEAIKAFEKAIVLNPKYYTSAQKNLDLARRELSSSLGDSGQ